MKSEDLEDIVEKIPEKMITKCRKEPNELYLVNRKVAKIVVEMLMQDFSTDNLCTFEGRPGLGMITEELLAAGVPTVELFEPGEHFALALSALREKYPQRLNLHTADLFYMWKVLYQDRMDNGHRLETLMANVPLKNWEEEPCMQVVGAVSNIYFLKHIITSTIFQSNIMSKGRPVLYLIMEPSIWLHLICDITAGHLLYRANTVLFQLLFDYKLIGKVPRKAFLPWQNNYVVVPRSKLTKVKLIDPDLMYVTRIEPKANLFADVVSREHLVPLWYFIKCHMISRGNRVIPHLEKWIPGCGPRLIAKDFNIYSQFGDLNPQEMLQLFKDFSSWPKFNESTFLSCMESVLLKSYDTTEVLKDDVEDDVEEPGKKVQSKIDSKDHAKIKDDSRAAIEDESHDEIEDESHEETEDESNEEIDDEFHEEVEDEDHVEIDDDIQVEFENDLGETKSRR